MPKPDPIEERLDALVGPALSGAGALLTVLGLIGQSEATDKVLAKCIVDAELELRSLARYIAIEASRRV